MNCYYCGQVEAAGGLTLTAPPAHGVCQRCGAGVCAEHGDRTSRGGEPAELLCKECTAAIRGSVRTARSQRPKG